MKSLGNGGGEIERLSRWRHKLRKGSLSLSRVLKEAPAILLIYHMGGREKTREVPGDEVMGGLVCSALSF